MKKKIIKDNLQQYISFSYQEFDIKELVIQLNAIKDDRYFKITFEIEQEQEAYTCNSYTIETSWYGYRYETDEELVKREAKSESAKKAAITRKKTIKETKRKELENIIKKDPELIKKILKEVT